MHDSQTVIPAGDRADRLFVAHDPPHAAAVVVWRRSPTGRDEFLVLHRRTAPDEGDWAWTPPAGTRITGETAEACARRELAEETGLNVAVRRIGPPAGDCALFEARVDGDPPILLSEEHDRCEWVSRDEAARRCQPAAVASLFRLDLSA